MPRRGAIGAVFGADAPRIGVVLRSHEMLSTTALARFPHVTVMSSRTIKFATILALIASTESLSAQTAPAGCPANPCGVTVNGSMTMTSVAFMTLTGTNVGTTTLTPPKAADFSTGFLDSNGPSLTVRSNTAVRVRVSPNAVTAWLRNGIASSKNASELLWSTTGAAPFTPVTTVTDLLSTGSATAGQTKNITYRVLYSFTTDIPGTWTLPLIFTLVSP